MGAKAIRILSIIGTILFGILTADLIAAIGMVYEDTLESITEVADFVGGLGVLAGTSDTSVEGMQNLEDVVYELVGVSLLSCVLGLILSICGCFVKVSKPKDVNTELLKLGELRDKGIISNDELEAKKRELLMR